MDHKNHMTLMFSPKQDILITSSKTQEPLQKRAERLNFLQLHMTRSLKL